LDCRVASSAFPSVWIRAVSIFNDELEIEFVLVLTVVPVTLIADCAGGIIGVLTPRSNPSVKRTHTGGAELPIYQALRAPVRAAYLRR